MRSKVVSGMAGSFWVGLNDRDSEGGYEWLDGKPFRFAHWAPGEPDNQGGSEDCVVWDVTANNWSDESCYLTWSFICQVPKGAVVTTPKPVPTPKHTLQCGNMSWA